MERSVIESVLKKLGVAEVDEKLSVERLIAKIKNRVGKHGTPSGLDEKEEALMIELDLMGKSATATDEAGPSNEQPPATGKGKKKAKAAAAKKAGKGATGGGPRTGLMDALRDAFAHKPSHVRTELQAKLLEKFGKEAKGSLNNYIWKSVHGDKSTGLKLKQEKNKDGKNILTIKK